MAAERRAIKIKINQHYKTDMTSTCTMETNTGLGADMKAKLIEMKSRLEAKVTAINGALLRSGSSSTSHHATLEEQAHRLRDTGITPLHLACKNGNLPEIEHLVVKSPFTFGLRNRTGNTPLHFASWKGHLHVVKFLVDKGADIRAKNLVSKHANKHHIIFYNVEIISVWWKRMLFK